MKPSIEYRYEAQALAEHDRMSRLFKENRFMFELERKKAIEKTINSAQKESRKKRLRELQDQWDTILDHSGSAHNRMVLMETLLWDAVTSKYLPILPKKLNQNGPENSL